MEHYSTLIAGGGPSGLYSAWRISQNQENPVAIFEWSPVRLGGRIYTKTFEDGQFMELGGMRFSSEHRVLQQVLTQLELTGHIQPFNLTPDRLYYLRGTHVNQSQIAEKGVPYNTRNPADRHAIVDTLFNRVAQSATGANPPQTREQWCHFFDTGVLPSAPGFESHVYQAGEIIGNIGYWNLMFDQLGSEAFQYAADAGGYTSNVINWNAANAIPYNGEFGSSATYQCLDQGFSLLFKTLEEKCLSQGVAIQKGQRLVEFWWNNDTRKFHCLFQRYTEDGATHTQTEATCDKLLLCMPKHSLELIHERDVVGAWPADKPRRVLKHPQGQYYIESIIQQPSYKIALMFDSPWWLDADHKPSLTGQRSAALNYGPTITDLPLRQIYYFGNNAPAGKYATPLYGLLASYDDMYYTDFWSGLELTPQERAMQPESEDLQPLFEGRELPEPMLEMVRRQLNEVHFDGPAMKVPLPIAAYHMNWERNPFYAGYHAWKAHYSLADSQYYMTRPSETIGLDIPLHVAGSAYSNDQAWVEGAFCTAEAILIDKLGLNPLVDTTDYPLICRPASK